MNRTLLPAIVLTVLGGCAQPNEYQEPPPPKVTVAKPLIQTVTNYLEETGTTEAKERVEIRARVDGFLEEIKFEEGRDVEADDVLYLIQKSEYEANVAAAEAEIAALEASLELAAADLKREEELKARDATTEANFDLATAKKNAASAALLAGQAALQQANLDLSYTDVVTPISGRAERTLVKQGNFVSGSPTTHLTTVVNYDPIHVYFNVSERAILRATDATRLEGEDKPDITDIPAYVRRATDLDYPFEGHLDYADLGVRESSGTFTLRGVFPNPNMQLLPGLFVRIRIPLGTIEDAILLPEKALASDQAGRYVMVLDDQNVVQRRNVVAGDKHGTMVEIRDGLTPDDTVVIDGLLRARPGVTVEPETITLSPDDAKEMVKPVELPAPTDTEGSSESAAQDDDQNESPSTDSDE